MAVVRVKWYHTEEFEADIEVDDEDLQEAAEFDKEEGIDMMLDEKLMDIIVNMDQKQLSLAFQGCTDREITEKVMLDAKRGAPPK